MLCASFSVFVLFEPERILGSSSSFSIAPPATELTPQQFWADVPLQETKCWSDLAGLFVCTVLLLLNHLMWSFSPSLGMRHISKVWEIISRLQTQHRACLLLSFILLSCCPECSRYTTGICTNTFFIKRLNRYQRKNPAPTWPAFLNSKVEILNATMLRNGRTHSINLPSLSTCSIEVIAWRRNWGCDTCWFCYR